MQTFRFICAFAGFCVIHASAADSALPERDLRAAKIQTLNTLRSFPEIKSRAAWDKRAEEIRQQVLVSCGLWPMPEKTPLKAKVFDRIEHDGYSVEKVYFQSYPGFYVAGNLYRPLGKKGPFPGILNPHGHWAKGRLEDGKDGSAAARCINFAKQGMVAFSWDMVGYNDTQFAQPAGEAGYKTHRHFANELTNQLWNISQMGLQTWNSVRALDFLCSLSDVDTNRLACTGESGGGTQTFMLGAIDDRLTVQAPIVMVSHSMQGGCSCENVACLRVDHSNMEIAAQPAPRPQLLVACTGDWTKMTMTLEGPAIASVYKLFNKEDQLRYVRFDFNHNYNKTSREAVYEWFGKWLLRAPEPSTLKEVAYTKEPDEALRVFPKGPPEDAVTEEQLAAYLINSATNQLWTYKPINPVLMDLYRKNMLPAWRHNLLIDWTESKLLVTPGKITKFEDCTATYLLLGREGKGDRIPAWMVAPRRDPLKALVILVSPEGKPAFIRDDGAPKGLARELINREIAVLCPDLFLTGENADEKAAAARDYSKEFFTGYNRTDAQERVQDLVTLASFARTHQKGGRRVVLCGVGRAGLWTMLASPVADAVVADCAQLDLRDDKELLAKDLFSPGLRKLGGFEGVAAIAGTIPIAAHNTGDHFSSGFLRTVYKGMHVKERYREESSAMSNTEIAKWISELR